MEILFQKQKIILRNDEEILLPLSLRVGADYADVMASRLHASDEVHRRSGRSVVLLAEDVAYDCDVHLLLKRILPKKPISGRMATKAAVPCFPGGAGCLFLRFLSALP